LVLASPDGFSAPRRSVGEAQVVADDTGAALCAAEQGIKSLRYYASQAALRGDKSKAVQPLGFRPLMSKRSPRGLVLVETL
jgi:hypothetical protein